MLAAKGAAIGAWPGLAAYGTRWDIMGRHGGQRSALLGGGNLKERLKIPEDLRKTLECWLPRMPAGILKSGTQGSLTRCKKRYLLPVEPLIGRSKCSKL